MFYRRYDNGPKFKGAVAQLANQLGIRMIRGRPYHPQTQGSIERANRTFKKRLTALQLALGTSQ
jgi:transposase InsO family protein